MQRCKIYRDALKKAACTGNSEECIDSPLSITEEPDDIEIPIPSADEIVCYKWSGSSNFRECREATGLTKIKSYPNTQVNNFVTRAFEGKEKEVHKARVISGTQAQKEKRRRRKKRKRSGTQYIGWRYWLRSDH